jgi:hypothetical protein
VDPSSIVAGVELGKSGWSLLQTLRSIAEAGTIGAYFRYDGTRVDGSAKINVELHYEGQAPGVWWYSVSALGESLRYRARRPRKGRSTARLDLLAMGGIHTSRTHLRRRRSTEPQGGLPCVWLPTTSASEVLRS